jgi:raffinose/stachyose/melibiose transport system permease protein
MKKRRLINWIIFVILIIGTIIILFPFYISIVTSMKTPAESARSYFSLPGSFNLDNFKTVITNGGFFRSALNSVIVTVISVVIMCTLTPVVAYAIARNNRKRLYKGIYIFFVMGMFIPFQIVMFPIIQTMTNLNMMNLIGLIILYASLSIPKTLFLFYGYMKTIPTEIDESAFIDGARVSQIYMSIIRPLLTPMTATVAIVQSLWVWNDFLLPLVILNRSKDYFTLPLYQYNFVGEYFVQYNIIFAAVTLSVIPVIIMYIFLQKYLINGLTEGAVKG